MVKTVTVLTHPTPACRDTPFRRQGCSKFGPRGVRVWYVEGNKRLRTPLVTVFTVSLMDDASDYPMPIVNHVDQQAREVHSRELRADLVFGKGREERVVEVPS